jgi:urease accessory protein
MDATAEMVCALLADARLPSGGHAQSAGLEPALLEGLAPASIAAYAAGRLRTVVRVEAAAACVARLVALGGPSAGLAAGLDSVEEAWAARTPSAAQRATSRQLGRGYLRLATRLWPSHPAVRALAAVPRPGPSRPVVLGALAAAAGLDAERTAFVCAYDDLQSVAAATLKLVPSDPLDVTAWVVGLAGETRAVVAATAGVTTPDRIPGAAAPLLEAQAERHALREQRLFHA